MPESSDGLASGTVERQSDHPAGPIRHRSALGNSDAGDPDDLLVRQDHGDQAALFAGDAGLSQEAPHGLVPGGASGLKPVSGASEANPELTDPVPVNLH